ncbi:hypothetical protein EG328_011462 [Venturia inaequalis]|uniref:Phosphotransferase n=1 Tax=Venturia inaequalis TaxID=5025 RepID=A0A8H3U508_VENIN|nr:hypothetical protein EG328_011462 [Venturia inaequalis]RDI88387.1 hypothetical protein Vi05172_g1311 [Venturia inaequalis]
MDDFLQEVRRLFQSPIDAKNMLDMSNALQEEFRQKLQSSDISMLPSYIYTLPSGQERGSYLALDVGGSTFRVAFVELSGRDNEKESMRIVKMCTYKICNSVKALEGHHFFDWMAEKIRETLDDPVVVEVHGTQTLIMGLAWSFPIKTTSPGAGTLLDMGKGFKAGKGVAGQDIGGLITLACQKKKLNVRLDAIINDGQATLLTRAYQDDATCFGLILGTGTNMSMVLPVKAFGKDKFGERSQAWFDNAEHVLVNTEMSMFGKQILPATRWDNALNKAHSMPDFQPLEYFIGGRYQGEIVRLILVNAIISAGLFDGQYPERFLEPYSLEASTMAAFEDADDTSRLSRATIVLQKQHPMTCAPSLADLIFVQHICQLVSRRAAAYLATAAHALWILRASSEGLSVQEAGHLSIGCNGSVIQHYPAFRELAQKHLDELVELSGGRGHSIVLEPAEEAAIFGAAVAAASIGCARDES